MTRLRIIDKIRRHVSSNPPSVIFTVCLVAFVFVLCSLALYVDQNQLRNPDEFDWNAFERNLADLDFCFKLPQSLTTDKVDITLKDKSVLDKFIIYFFKSNYDMF